MNVIIDMLCLIAGGILGWSLVQHGAWAITFRADGYPYNWRVFLGPARYAGWVLENKIWPKGWNS